VRIDFPSTPEQDELVRSLATLVERRSIRGPMRRDQWEAVGELGALALGSELGGGSTTDLVVAAGELGWSCAQGPLVGAVLGVRVLDARAEAIAAGSTTVGVHDGTVTAWSEADVVLDCANPGEWWLAELDRVTPFDSLADEPWATGTVRRLERIDVPFDAVAAAELARAAWLAGAGRRVVDLASAHARERRQFGQPIGNFQAVAHPLAMATAQLGAARDLVHVAAVHLDARAADPAQVQAARAVATDAALTAAFASHQVHGAVGFSAERGLDRWSAAIRQLSHHPPAPDPDRLIDAARRRP
jgi:alkylation response protein AidB-like acyl-CoA dehydrogenase